MARRTGLSTHVLRAWERRYGAVEPKRSGGATRVYDDADVLKLRLLKRLTESGHAIGRVARLSTEELLTLLRDDSGRREPSRTSGADRQMAACLEAVEAMDGTRIHAVLMRSVVMMGSSRFVDELVVPTLYRVGELWERGSICPAHEHLFSASLQRVLAWMMERLAVEGEAPVIITTTPSGQRHEMGALISGTVAAEEGWRVEHLGADLPADDIARAAAALRARVVALSVVHETSALSLIGEIGVLRDRLPADVQILIGGRAASQHREQLVRAGVIWLPGLGDLRNELRGLQRRSRASG